MKSKLLYIKVYEGIIECIISGKLQSGDKVRSVRDMAMDMQVNPKTIQKAFKYLDDKKIFVSKKGEGRYVTEDDKVLNEIRTYFIEKEIEEFLEKMDRYNVSLDDIISFIKKEQNEK